MIYIKSRKIKFSGTVQYVPIHHRQEAKIILNPVANVCTEPIMLTENACFRDTKYTLHEIPIKGLGPTN